MPGAGDLDSGRPGLNFQAVGALGKSFNFSKPLVHTGDITVHHSELLSLP